MGLQSVQGVGGLLYAEVACGWCGWFAVCGGWLVNEVAMVWGLLASWSDCRIGVFILYYLCRCLWLIAVDFLKAHF